MANAPALATGRAPARIPIMLDPSLAHRHRTHVARHCKTRTRVPRATVDVLWHTWYLVPDRQQRPISSCFKETRWAYHEPACTSFPPDTVDEATTETSRGKKRLAPTTLPVDSTRTYIRDLCGNYVIPCLHLAACIRLRFNMHQHVDLVWSNS